MDGSQTFAAEFMNTVRGSVAPEPVFDKLRERIVELVGCGLFTASVFDRAAGRSRRIYSENPSAYPVGGFKPIEPNRWTGIVLDDRRTFASTTIEEIAEVFSDWKLIQSLGFESNANLPVVVGSEVIGTLNLLEKKGHYTRERLARGAELMPWASIAFLVAERFERAGEARA